jgi:thymidylate synthase ThyX
MTIEVEVLAMSQFDLATLRLRYPRINHCELLRHRVFSHSVVSSRAVGFSNMCKAVQDDIALPVEWISDKKGMVGGAEISAEDAESAEAIWRKAFASASAYAHKLHALGVHHSISNRLIEPFMHINQAISSCHWDNFFKLRISEFADPTLNALAVAMLNAMTEYKKSKPPAIWEKAHIPFVDDEEKKLYDILTLMKISAARCARMSYTPIGESSRDVQKDIVLADKLLKQSHFSPFEHQAVYLSYDEVEKMKEKISRNWSGNFNQKSWLQARFIFEHLSESQRKKYAKVSA